MATVDDFKTWAKSDLRRFTSENLKDHCLLDESRRGDLSDYEYRASLKIYTDTNQYTITAIESSDRPHGYLGCMSSARKTRAGENQHRGSDLADGPLDYQTWIRILMDILSYEMVRVAKRQVHYIDTGRLDPPTAQKVVDRFNMAELTKAAQTKAMPADAWISEPDSDPYIDELIKKHRPPSEGSGRTAREAYEILHTINFDPKGAYEIEQRAKKS